MDSGDNTLPPHPTSGLLTFQSIGENPHDKWISVAAHTAKCDKCLQYNKTVLQRCKSCNLQLCFKCIVIHGNQGLHVANVDKMTWVPESKSPFLKPGKSRVIRHATRAHNNRKKPTSSGRAQTNIQVTRTSLSSKRTNINLTTKQTSFNGNEGLFVPGCAGPDDEYVDDEYDSPSHERQRTEESFLPPHHQISPASSSTVPESFLRPPSYRNTKTEAPLLGTSVGRQPVTESSLHESAHRCRPQPAPSSLNDQGEESFLPGSLRLHKGTIKPADNASETHEPSISEAIAEIIQKRRGEFEDEKRRTWQNDPAILSLRARDLVDEARELLEEACEKIVRQRGLWGV